MPEYAELVYANLEQVQLRLEEPARLEALRAAAEQGVRARLERERTRPDGTQGASWVMDQVKQGNLHAVGSPRLTHTKRDWTGVVVEVLVGGESGLLYLHRFDPEAIQALLGEELVTDLQAPEQ